MANDRDDPTIYLVNPERRGILPLDGFHIPRSLRKTVRRRPFDIRCNTAFRQVITACADPTPERPRTWLNDGLIELYVELHHAGHAHSVECWQDGRLAGGLYGVSLGGAFFGESMFSYRTDASKVALVDLIGRLLAGHFLLLDTQFVTDHLRRFGALEIARTSYLSRLRRALRAEARFPSQAYPFGEGLVTGAASGSEGGSGNDTAGGGDSASTGSAQLKTQTS
ncbi:leucyl/phenylalanyl-tRNA--protein transferase [Arboricoccus pini]|uniref:Leucyl/phenylalanyl-tRNA--protein transferase n=1 Tax=Arboricoccus pini TaxID=1963835 RepID=A0A212QNM5_9PROT|nr:leucyl/phenylalanyl-tRNA--protein transferase [Arboricoccus pini]